MKLPSFSRWLYKMEYRHGNKAIQNLMLIIAIGMGIVYVGGLINPMVLSYLTLSREALFQGQVWRLLTFIFFPPLGSNILFTVIGIYFYYSIGAALENAWGAFKFNVFYFTGVVFMIISALITGSASSAYLNLSLFFAFAILFPDTQFYLFFFIPIKAKWLAIVDLVLYVFLFVIGNASVRVSIGMVALLLFIFFGSNMITAIKNFFKYRKTRSNFKRNNRNNTIDFK